jgi:hypothetical protein
MKGKKKEKASFTLRHPQITLYVPPKKNKNTKTILGTLKNITFEDRKKPHAPLKTNSVNSHVDSCFARVNLFFFTFTPNSLIALLLSHESHLTRSI